MFNRSSLPLDNLSPADDRWHADPCQRAGIDQNPDWT